jgi:kynurenine formamidase
VRSTGLALAGLALGFIASASASAQDEQWHPSRYGPNDTLGAINELSPAVVLQAAQLIKTGKTYALGVETGRDTPAYGSRSFQLFVVAHGDGAGAALGKNKTTFNDDWMTTWLGIGTQLDGLGHLGIDHRYYNGVEISEIYRPEGLARFATHLIPPIVTRGILLDIAGFRKVDMLEGGTEIGRADIEGAARRQKLALRRADVVILHTGWQRLASEDPKRFLESEPGLGLNAARHLASLGVVAIGADSWGLEVVPNPDPELVFPVHQELLARNGVYILENIRTDQLLADKAWEFLFVLGQPKFVGAVQMVINPVAIR